MELCINKTKIGPGNPTYIVAEVSANHNQDFDQAVRILGEAKKAGANAVKLQTYTPDTLTIDCRNEHFFIHNTIWEGKSLHELYAEAYTPWDWHPRLKEVADSLGLDLFSTPFDHTAVDFLEDLGMPAHKIASFEIVDMGLLKKIGATGKPVIMSTGMATLAEIDEAVRTLRGAGCPALALLKCSSAYPSTPGLMNLRTIPHLAEAFGVPAGLSDHTLGISAAVASVALGACIVEKHVTLARDIPGPDSSFSLEPHELKDMITAIRETEQALGTVNYAPTESEKASLVFRRSLFVVSDVRAGEVFDERNVRCIRPGHGLHSRYLDEVLGRKAACDVAKGTPLDWKMIG